jgi:hypothetical protein|eukprot:30873-Pelagococcus_subviridis.AAC.4
MPRDLSQHAAVAAADDEHLLGFVVQRAQRQVRDHLLVRELVAFGALNHAVENEDFSVRRRLENHDVLEVGLAAEEHLLHLERHRLTGPHLVGDFAEPAFHRGVHARVVHRGGCGGVGRTVWTAVVGSEARQPPMMRVATRAGEISTRDEGRAATHSRR